MARIPNFIRGGGNSSGGYTSIYDNPRFGLKEPGKNFLFCKKCRGKIYPDSAHRCDL